MTNSFWEQSIGDIATPVGIMPPTIYVKGEIRYMNIQNWGNEPGGASTLVVSTILHESRKREDQPAENQTQDE